MESEGSRQARAPSWIDEPRNIAWLLVLQGLFGLAVGLAIWWGTGRDLADFVGLGTEDLIVGAVTAAVLIGSMQAILILVPGFLSWAAEQQRELFEHGRAYAPAHILVISIGAGIGEEALFRGGLQTVLGDHLPAWAAIALVSFAFAAVHLKQRVVSAFIFFYGAAFGAVYHYSGSLAGVMIAHALFDVWALFVLQREMERQGIVKGRTGAPDPQDRRYP
jgi:uncharacterized protein